MDNLLSPRISELQKQADEISRQVLRPRAAEIDEQCLWPAESLQVLADRGLTGLHVPLRLGGEEQGLLALATVCEALAQGCASTSICFGMHCVATAVVAAKTTPYHEERFLVPVIKQGAVASLALSEPGTGSHFYFPQCSLKDDDHSFVLSGEKQFVTSGGYADFYIVSSQSSQSAAAGEFNCLVVEKNRPGMEWQAPWRGFGMRGNSSRGLRLNAVCIPKANLLGQEGDQIWYIFEVIAPYFLMAMAGTYLGIAQAALDFVVDYVKQRSYGHSGKTLAQESSFISHEISRLWLAVEAARGIVYRAARLADSGDPEALVPVFMAKVAASEAATQVTQDGLRLCGGSAYRDNAELTRLLRDAGASHIMSPTTDMLKAWAGRALLGLPIL
jgi:alkylation response protein AidB-like acyl-CoA dehydrogenase